jgi:hypothetical protein
MLNNTNVFGTTRRRAVIAGVALAVVTPVVAANPAAAVNSYTWTFTSTPSATGACPVGGDNVTLKAVSGWSIAPKNGYMTLLRGREAVDDDGDVVVTNRMTYTTKNTAREGSRRNFHWTDWTTATSIQRNNYYTRSVWRLQWKKDDAFRDTLVKTVTYASPWCIQQES